MDHRGIVRILAAALLLAAGVASGSPGFEGTPIFSLSPQVIEMGGAQDPIEILVTMGGECQKNAIGRAIVSLEPGLEWIDGDRERVGHPSYFWDGPRDNQWSIRVRASGPCSTTVRASLSVKVNERQTDEVVMLLPIVIVGDNVTVGTLRTVRQESVRDGQRYRYAGLFLVPIDGPEEVTTADIEHHPVVTQKQTGRCDKCPAKVREITLVAFVGADGRVIASRSIDESLGNETDQEITRAARVALSKWRFTPAKAKSRSVAHWVFVRVPVQGP
jgi:hypothetical protein